MHLLAKNEWNTEKWERDETSPNEMRWDEERKERRAGEMRH